MTHARTRRWTAGVAGIALALAVGGTGAGAAVAQSVEPAASTPVSASPSAPASATQDAAPATEDAVPAVTQSDPHSNDVWVPDWMLLVVAGAVVAAAVSLATRSYLRFTRTRRELEG
ncbi:hypothetical protein [uncultured Corynebacterium sp.]|uniref:hypothetical protein n=1 Tax=uncultured Corynebacterium sp. TaxID=159447 RepID=UPI0025F2D8BC|nr:hypothetical protein [uncultured Corynebacterium sp.]